MAQQARALDRLVAEHVMGYRVEWQTYPAWTGLRPVGLIDEHGTLVTRGTAPSEEVMWRDDCPRFSTDIGDAWLVVERMRQEPSLAIWGEFSTAMGGFWNDTATAGARTICECALAALGVAVPHA